MADQVTVSTFLELKDNMSKGLKRLEALLRGIESAAGGAKIAVDGFNKTAQAAAAGIRLTRAVQDKAEKEAKAAQKQQELAEARQMRETSRLFAQRERVAQSTARSEERMSQTAARAEERSRSIRQRQTEREAKHAQRVMAQQHSDRMRSIASIQSAAGQIRSTVSNIILALGVGTAVKQIFNVGRAYEELTMQIAGTLSAFKMTPTFGIAQNEAKKVYEYLEEKAAKLPGEVEEYAQVFAAGLPKLIASGMRDVQQIADFTSRYTAALYSMVDPAQAGRDLFEMLSGRARSDVKSFRVLQEHIAMTTEEFNKLSISARMAKISDAIKHYDDAIAAMGDQFGAKFDTLISKSKALVRVGTEPLFEAAKNTLDRINQYLTENKDKITAAANEIASRLVPYLTDVENIAKSFGDNLSDAYDIAVALIGLWAASTTISVLSSAATAFERIRDAMLAMQATGLLAPLGKALKFAPKGIGAAGAAAAGLGAFLYSPDLEDESKNTAFLSNQEKAIANSKKYGAILKDIPAYYRELGLFAPDVPALPQNQFDFGEKERLTREIASWYEKYRYIGATGGMYDPNRMLQLAEYMGLDPDAVAKMGGFTPGAGVGAGIMGRPRKVPKERTHTINDFRFSRFDIKQEFAEGFDPDRIAVAFASDLARLGEFKVQSMNSPVLSGATQ